MKMMVCLMILLLPLLVACGGPSPVEKHSQSYEVKRGMVYNRLNFTGTIQPIQESSLTSPAEAVVDTLHVEYGQRVKKGALVLTLSSAEWQKQYNDTLTDYLKAKDSFNVAQAKFRGTDDLWHAGLLSKNNYVSEQSSLNTARVSWMQASTKLSELLEKTGEATQQDVSKLSFSAFEHVRQALATKHNLIHIKALNDGVLLYPPKSADDKVGHLTVGSTVKSGQVLALIGDLSGVRITIDVPEVDLDKITVGMPATIRGVAFATHEMTGRVASLNAQASTNSPGSLPSFTAIVEVQTLTPAEQAFIKVGMSATIELASRKDNQLLIPIEAVKQKNGRSVVLLRDAGGAVHDRIVTTGAAHADQVVIDSGLQLGDVIVYG